MQTFYRPWDGVSGAAGDTIDWRSVTLKSIEISPNDVVYGSPRVSIDRASSRNMRFTGPFYPKQNLNIRLTPTPAPGG